MKTYLRTITVTLIALAVAGLFAVNPVAAQPPVPGLLISSEDMAFLEAAPAGTRTPVPGTEVVGLFSAIEVRHLATPYAPGQARVVSAAAGEIPGLMISGADLRFILGPAGPEDGLPETWANGTNRFGIGR